MFFDTVATKEDSQKNFLDIALLQQELLELRYDKDARMPKTLKIKRKGLFGQELIYEPMYIEKIALLNQKKQILMAQRQKEGYNEDILWWNLAWEHIVPRLLWNLTFPLEEQEQDEAGWRRGYQIFSCAGIADHRLLCLDIQGHWQGKSFSDRSVYDVEHSAYTKKEREELVEIYNDKQNTQALKHIAFANNVGVHSITTGWDYDTAYDYYSSPEYLADRLRDMEHYSQSLYTVEETNHLHVRAASKNTHSIHAIAEYHLDTYGNLDFLAVMDFAKLVGTMSDETKELLAQKDAAVISAFWLAQLGEFQKVSLSLFTKGMEADIVSFQDVMRQAQIITCLADKIEGR